MSPVEDHSAAITTTKRKSLLEIQRDEGGIEAYTSRSDIIASSRGSRKEGLPILATLGEAAKLQDDQTAILKNKSKRPKSKSDKLVMSTSGMTFIPIFDPKVHKRGPTALGAPDRDVLSNSDEEFDHEHDDIEANKKFNKLNPKNRFH